MHKLSAGFTHLGTRNFEDVKSVYGVHDFSNVDLHSNVPLIYRNFRKDCSEEWHREYMPKYGPRTYNFSVTTTQPHVSVFRPNVILGEHQESTLNELFASNSSNLFASFLQLIDASDYHKFLATEKPPEKGVGLESFSSDNNCT